MNPPIELSAQLQWAARGLLAIQRGESSTDWLGQQCPVHLRPGVQALLMTALRRWGTTRALCQLLVPKAPAPEVDALLCVGLGLLTQTPPPYPDHTLVSQAVEAAKKDPRTRALAALINACLRRCVREREALLSQVQSEESARWNHPTWWVAKVRKDHPKHWQAILEQAHRRPPLVLRVNPKKIELEIGRAHV